MNNAAGYVLGLPNCPLGKLYEPLPCKDVRLSTRVAELVFDSDSVTGVRAAVRRNPLRRCGDPRDQSSCRAAMDSAGMAAAG